MELLHQEGETIGQRYLIDGILGEGGSGTTYQSKDLQTGQAVALKALSLRHLSDWKMIELFEREAAVLAQLEHSSIPRYLEYFNVDTPTDRCFYIAQELAPGESLAALVEKGWHATETEVRSIAINILEILVYLHQQKPPVIHRDIKPQNIIHRDDGQIFLVDFGAVQQTYHSTLARGSTVVGTFGYMAPEQFTGKAVPATDLYGLGATLLFLLTHRSPAELPIDRLKIDFRSHVQISEEFADWLEKILSPDVEDRFHSASEALAVLQGKRKLRIQVANLPRQRLFFKLSMTAIAVVIVANNIKYPHLIPSFLGFTPKEVHQAINRGEVETVRNYLELGVNANAKSKGLTMLHKAASRGDNKMVELLIAKGADVNARDNDGKPPLYEVRSPEMVELLIAKGADPNAKVKYGLTLLQHLILLGEPREEIVKSLIANGADVNAEHRSGATALLLAAKKNKYRKNQNMVKLLIASGADVKVTLKNSFSVGSYSELGMAKGTTPLIEMVEGNDLEIVELLIAKGADVNARTYRETPLFKAVSYSENIEIGKLLIAKGADVNAKDDLGRTPLHWARNPEVVELLIAKGADVNAKDNNGETPLRWARNPEIIDLLESHGAKY